MSALDEDIEDLHVVVQYLQKTFGYVIDLIVGHSRGSIIAMRWLSTTEEGRRVRSFVNVAGRHRMEVWFLLYPFGHNAHKILEVSAYTVSVDTREPETF